MCSASRLNFDTLKFILDFEEWGNEAKEIMYYSLLSLTQSNYHYKNSFVLFLPQPRDHV